MSDEIESVWAERTVYITADCPECGHAYVFLKGTRDDEIIGFVAECQNAVRNSESTESRNDAFPQD